MIANSRNWRSRLSASGTSRTGANTQTTKSSREAILSAIRANLPKQEVEHPPIPAFQLAGRPLKPTFDQHLREAGEDAHDVGSVAEAEAKLITLHPGAKVVCSGVPEIPGTRRVEKVHDPHQLTDVDVGVVRATSWKSCRGNSGVRRAT